MSLDFKRYMQMINCSKMMFHILFTWKYDVLNKRSLSTADERYIALH